MPTSEIEAVLDRLKEASGSSTDQELADKLGIVRQNITSARKNNKVPDRWVSLACIKYGYFHKWIYKGEGPKNLQDLNDTFADRLRPIWAGVKAQAQGDEYLSVPLCDGKVQAGEEGGVLFDQVVDVYPFKQSWVEARFGKGDKHRDALFLVRVRGDSMVPTISQGELVLVDTHENERLSITNGKIYLVRMPDGHVTIKRLVGYKTDLSYKIMAISDNPGNPPFEFDLDPGRALQWHVLGRVRWAGKEFD